MRGDVKEARQGAMIELDYRIESAAEVDDEVVGAMFGLYSRYYDGTSEQLFRHDLSEKHYVILLEDSEGVLQGFSTALVNEHEFQGERVRSYYSGDTVVDERYWGQQALPTASFRLTGHIKAAEPETPLYWFLLVKGHRTYRYLSTFFKTYYPNHEGDTPSHEKIIMAMLAIERFGPAYDHDRGIVSFDTSHGHLKPALAEIPEKDRDRPLVKYFLQRNPGYVQGEELVCLTELAPDNLRPLAERLFRQGMESGY